jgi:hypothetical protein
MSERGPSRRGFLARLALAVPALAVLGSWLRLGETVARAERRRRNHRGATDGFWIGHC